MWDNTAPGAKKNPKGPDYKCKDKNCNKAVWLKKTSSIPSSTPTNGAATLLLTEAVAVLKDIRTLLKGNVIGTLPHEEGNITFEE